MQHDEGFSFARRGSMLVKEKGEIKAPEKGYILFCHQQKNIDLASVASHSSAFRTFLSSEEISYLPVRKFLKTHPIKPYPERLPFYRRVPYCKAHRT
jgi:hypothetical protein